MVERIRSSVGNSSGTRRWDATHVVQNVSSSPADTSNSSRCVPSSA
jgi:hypothetical protein